MACDFLTKGRSKKCKESIGGNLKLYVWNSIEEPFTIVNGEATAMNVLLTESFEYDLVGNGNPYEQSLVTDRETQTVTNTQTITALFSQMDAATSLEFNLMAKGYPQAIIRDRNNKYYLVGQTEGIDFNITATTGGAQKDFNGYTVVGTSIEQNLSPILDEATVTAFLSTVAANV